MIKLKDLLTEFTKSDIVKGADNIRLYKGNRINVKYVNSNNRTKTAIFKASDPKGSKKLHEVRVNLAEYVKISRLRKNITNEEKLKLALEAGDIKVHCSCPDFLYKGFKYIADQLDYGIRRETRPPNIKNPKREGTVCKHLVGTFKYIDNVIGRMSQDFKQ